MALYFPHIAIFAAFMANNMYQIVATEQFSEKVYKYVVRAPRIARARKAGHFIILRVDENGERIPLTVAAADPVAGTVTLVVQETGVSSAKLCALKAGDHILDMVGPLGQATRIRQVGTVLACGGGVGVAPLLPIVEAFKKAGNRVVCVLAARSKELIILENEIRQWSDEVLIMTDDGSYGEKGVVTAGAEKIISREKIDECIVIGPAIMMKFTSLLTKQYGIPTQASLNAIMVDGTGMCGACRVSVDGKIRFTCIDGPEFDAHKVDFDELLRRLGGYKHLEQAAFQEYLTHQPQA
ncbi:MAG: sulfide/dihydroorotate dehydrogenase-like FAD/NAD-binding protein [Bacteroidales bacterium]|jgi:NAD(P)H-flavin reductase|nr:sulfide/dihydroorotate dehydrogenase-like FAD/NAD-binding protein [Bacteroidales bacterium]